MGCICICKIIPTHHPNLPHSCKLHHWELSPGPSDLRFGVFDHYTNMPHRMGSSASGLPGSWVALQLVGVAALVGIWQMGSSASGWPGRCYEFYSSWGTWQEKLV